MSIEESRTVAVILLALTLALLAKISKEYIDHKHNNER